jgi:hypothetical protein
VAAVGVLLILGGALGLARSPLVAATTGHAEPGPANDHPQWTDEVSARRAAGTGR